MLNKVKVGVIIQDYFRITNLLHLFCEFSSVNVLYYTAKHNDILVLGIDAVGIHKNVFISNE